MKGVTVEIKGWSTEREIYYYEERQSTNDNAGKIYEVPRTEYGIWGVKGESFDGEGGGRPQGIVWAEKKAKRKTCRCF